MSHQSSVSELRQVLLVNQHDRQTVQKQVKWRIQSIPTSIFIGRAEKPASSNAGRIANLADLPRIIRKIRTFEPESDDCRDSLQRLDNTSIAFSVYKAPCRDRQILPFPAEVLLHHPLIKEVAIVPMQIGMPYGSSIMRGFRSAAMRDNSEGFLMTIHSLRIRRKFS